MNYGYKPLIIHIIYKDDEGVEKTLKYDFSSNEQIIANKIGLSQKDYLRARARMLLEEELGISDKESLKKDFKIVVKKEKSP